MRDHHELELKWALTATDHGRLYALLTATLGPAQRLAQDNQFFDTADLRLRAARMNMRVRRENQHVILTCKHKLASTQAVDGLSAHREWEGPLPADLIAGIAAPDAAWSAALPVPEPVRHVLAGQPVLAMGGFSNHREAWEVVRDGVTETLCLDCTTFSEAGNTRLDYELEIETSDPQVSAAYWRACFGRWQIPVVVQPLTKFARFLKTARG